MGSKNLICRECGWVHFAVSRAYVEAEIQSLKTFLENANEETRKRYRENVRDPWAGYMSCFRCGNPYSNFREARPEEIPKGSTLQPILTDESQMASPLP